MAISLARHKGTLGLSALKYLLGFFPESPNKSSTQLDPNILTAILAFTSSRDSWTTSAAQGLAQSLLSFYTSQIHSKEFIIDHVIQSFIRPLFSKSKPEAITSTGRKAMPTSAPPKKHDVAELDRGSRPWKYEAPYSVTVFAWAVNNASVCYYFHLHIRRADSLLLPQQEIITDHWNMFIPPLLTLLDTPTTSILVRGLETLTAFLPEFSSKLLQQTGLGEVFEDAVMPTLLYLPSITPMEESVQILPAAFDALFILVNVRYPTLTSSTSTAFIPRSDSKTSSTNLNTSDQRLALLDRLLRKGILTAHLHASDHPQIATILLSSLSTTVLKMGINCVKHLKDILPILTQAMTDPFAASRPEGLVEAVKCLESVILNAWPRMGLQDGGHGMEVVRMLVVCWGIVTEGLEENVVTKERVTLLEEVERGLRVAGALLMKAMEAMDPSMDVKVELKPLLTADASLEEVFGFDSKG